MKLFLFLTVEGEQQVCVIFLTSHTGTDLESVEAVILLCCAIRQDADTAFRKSSTRSFVLCELSYTSVFETRPADELLCHTCILCYCCCLLLETIALHCNAVSYPDALSWLLAVLGRFFAFLCPDGVTGCGVMGECEWTECEAGWRFFLWVQWQIDTEIFSGSLTSLEYYWRGNPPFAASNQDTPWFSSSLDCQVK